MFRLHKTAGSITAAIMDLITNSPCGGPLEVAIHLPTDFDANGMFLAARWGRYDFVTLPATPDEGTPESENRNRAWFEKKDHKPEGRFIAVIVAPVNLHKATVRAAVVAAMEKRIKNLRESDPSEMADAIGVVESYPK